MVERFNIKTVEAVATVTKILEEAHYNNTEPSIPICSFLTRPEDQQPAQAAEPAAEPEKKDDTSADDDDFTFDGLFDDMVEEESAEDEKNK